MAYNFSVLVHVCFTLFLSICYAFVSQGCPAEFGDFCECSYVPYGPENRLTYITNCTNAGFDNALMLRKLPPETEVLVFVGNEIKDLPLNIFGQENVYEKLHTIDLSNNHIQTIKGKTFHNVANVTKLILNDNDLYIISKDHHPRMFSNFVNLKELHLRNAFTEKVKAGEYLSNLLQIFENSYLFNLRVLNMENNEISRIDQGEFCSLAVLEELYLAHNHLNDIPLNFSCLKYLKKLDVRSNLIPYLSDQTLKSLESNKQLEINLTSNPFKCDCRMIKTFEWMLTTLVTLSNKEQLYCFDGFPSNVGKRIFTLHLSNLQCTDNLSEMYYHSSAAFIISLLALFCLAIIMGVIMYKNRVIVSSYLRRAFYPICDKFHYVSLDRREGTMSV